MNDLTLPSDPGNGPAIKHDPCEPWCEYHQGIYDMDDHEDYCLRPVGRAVMARTDDDVVYEISASQAHLRLPVTASTELQGHANRYHRGVVQLVGIPHDDGDRATLFLNVKPSVARSLAAILVRAADHVEGLAR